MSKKKAKQRAWADTIRDYGVAAFRAGYAAANHRHDLPDDIPSHSWVGCKRPECSPEAREANEAYIRFRERLSKP